MGATPQGDSFIRKTICLARAEPDVVIHDGDKVFGSELGRLYSHDESKLLEELVEFKHVLRTKKMDEFWTYLTERMAEILGAQMTLVAKRILMDEQQSAIEMPPVGEPGACLMATAFHYNDGKGKADTVKLFKYHAYACPCGYMRHDKVFIVPERLNDFAPRNPNDLPVPCDAYIGIPLFADGKCFAHFAVMWSEEGTKNRKFSWPTIELFLHSLEDIILQRLLEGTKFKEAELAREKHKIIPHEAVTAAQSLKPYAKSLSHELRTPMQGVVGMLDVMYATVLEAAEGQTNEKMREIFETLRENIETVQDSSRRAVEAADNVVHAYDMDLHLPELSPPLVDGDGSTTTTTRSEDRLPDRPEILVAGSSLPLMRNHKRGRDDTEYANAGSPSKIAATRAAYLARAEPSDELRMGVYEAEELRTSALSGSGGPTKPRITSPTRNLGRAVAPGLRHTQLRTVLQYVVNEGLKVGGRPDSTVATPTDTGEIIEVQTKSSNGEKRTKFIEWSVDDNVPSAMFVDERDLGKLVSCVFLNAIKFTDQGRIMLRARLSSRSSHIVINVSDTGPGIPAAFLPRLFQPFSQEDPSLTRHSEGLGLGLLVAKGIARKLGGDLTCVRADTSGPDHGSEFEIQVPVTPTEQSGPSTPTRTDKEGRGMDINSMHTATPTRVLGPPSAPTLTEEPKTMSGASSLHKSTVPGLDTLLENPLYRSVSGMTPPTVASSPRPAFAPRKSSATISDIDRNLATKYPLSFLVAEDNQINRKLLVNMLSKFGYRTVHEAYDGTEAVRQMKLHDGIDVVLMDLWMPYMDGYEATENILNMDWEMTKIPSTIPSSEDLTPEAPIPSQLRRRARRKRPTVLAVTADVTDGALERAAKVGMKGFMTKPFKMLDLQRLILEYCANYEGED